MFWTSICAINTSKPMYSIKDIAEYIVALTAAFARRFSLTETEAYKYLHKYGAISVAHEYYITMWCTPSPLMTWLRVWHRIADGKEASYDESPTISLSLPSWTFFLNNKVQVLYHYEDIIQNVEVFGEFMK